MTRPALYALTAIASVYCIGMTTACSHRAAVASRPAHVQQSEPPAPMTPDQANTATWTKAWTNLVNDVEQTFVPSLPKVVAIEVELVLGNPGPPDDTLTMTLLDSTRQSVAAVSQIVPAAHCDRVLFIFPHRGVEVSPGQVYSIRLSGGTTFGWKYVVGGYEKGAASFNGGPLLQDARSTFLFRTFGAP